MIARDGTYLVFVEVKYRKSVETGRPEEAVGPAKQRKIVLAASRYLAEKVGGEDIDCRFDVISILGDEICHYENAFDAGGIL